MINVNGLKRNAKNIVKKYSDAQIKVREATSNDPWGPSSTIMAEIADLTYNVVAFSEIMQMIWKRLNDHGKNWRHVYKALVLLEYLIKTGSDKVTQQCTDNIFNIQTLKDFQYTEENKDHGMNIREKSKKLVALLKDSEKLRAERERALKAKSRLAESMSSVGKGSLGSMIGASSVGADTSSAAAAAAATTTTTSNAILNGTSYMGPLNLGAPSTAALAGIINSDLSSARPQTATEEENQLKLALALSKEEAEQQEKTRKNDELRLKLALDVSKKTAGGNPQSSASSVSSSSSSSITHPQVVDTPLPQAENSSTIDDLLGLTIPPPPAPAPVTEPQNDPWSSDPWQSAIATTPAAPTATTLTTNTALNTITVNQSLAAPIAVPASTLLTSNNIFNSKRTASKNPFED